MQALRQARASLQEASFEGVLHAAETAEGGAMQRAAMQAVLLRRPRVFMLAVVWESPQVRERGCLLELACGFLLL